MKLFLMGALLGTSWFCCAQNVNPFTGAYSQSFPLLHVPSERGPGIGLSAVYQAGIGVEQPASEIGLGWNLEGIGEISRNTVGVPDDIFQVKSYLRKDVANTIVTKTQGALYPDRKSADITAFDLVSTRKGIDTAEITLPGFDIYNVRGPGISGNMKLRYLKFYTYTNTHFGEINYNGNNVNMPYDPPFAFVPDLGGDFGKPQFHFEDSFFDTLVSRHYPNRGNLSIGNFKTPSSNISGLGYPLGSTAPFIGRHLSGSTISNENIDFTKGYLATANLVQYLRNGEIDSMAYYPASNYGNFIDYRPTHSRSGQDFPPEGLGAFQITDARGFTYHYALPVYQRGSTCYRFPLKNDYSVPSSLSLNDLASVAQPTLLYPANPTMFVKTIGTECYALKWLLTAITGPDYEDNGNYYPDQGDKGYWVRYDYEKWTSGFIERTPCYGFNIEYAPDRTIDRPFYFPLDPPNPNNPELGYRIPGMYGTAYTSTVEIYYLNKIRTSSHTAVFIRDLRLDKKGGYSTPSVPAGQPMPTLMLKRVLLFANDDFDNLFAAYSSPMANPGYDFSLVLNSGSGIYSEAAYQARTGWDAHIIKHVAFDTDYSLCKQYHRNVNVNCPGSTVLQPAADVQSNLTVNNPESSGKLTLKRLLTYEYQNVKLTPSIKFQYGSNNVLLNPDYNPIKADYWGFYKSDATTNGYSRYTSPNSSAYTKAWSLTDVEDPLGGKLVVTYESNTYNRVVDMESSNGLRGASFVYRIRRSAQIGVNFQVRMEEGLTPATRLNEFVTLATASVPGLKKAICIPQVKNVVPWTTPCFGCDLERKGFAFGDCSLNLINTANGVTDSISGYISTTCASQNNCNNPRFAEYISGRRYKGWYSTFGFSTFIEPYSWYTNDGIAYSGNGFILLQTPIGYNVYGGGIRVKSIQRYNSPTEGYTKEYSYSDGVALNEPDRFEFPRLKKGASDNTDFNYDIPPHYGFLEPKEYGSFVLPALVGYSKVSERDYGRVSIDNGTTDSYFITDPNYANKAFFDSTTTVTSSYGTGLGINWTVKTIHERISKFQKLFGTMCEQRVFDRNGNMLSKVVNEFEPTQQGALVENYYFYDRYYYVNYPPFYKRQADNFNSGLYFDASGTGISEIVNINREVPFRLKRTTKYTMNAMVQQEIVRCDEITGEPTTIRTLDENGSSSLFYSKPAYTFYQAADGIPFSSPDFRKLLSLQSKYFQYHNYDSTMTPLSGNRSTTFSDAKYNLFSKYFNRRQFTTNGYVTQPCTLAYYANKQTFQFNSGRASLNDYGIFDKSKLYQNTLNPASIKGTLHWEPGATPYNWKLLSEITLIDADNRVLESRDGFNRFRASKFGYNGYYKTSEAGNCNYASYTYSGFEWPPANTGNGAYEGDLVVSNHVVNSNLAHTGKRCVTVNGTPVRFYAYSQTSTGGSIPLGLLPGRIYRVSAWVHNTNLTSARIQVAVSGFVNGAPYSSNFLATSASNLATAINNWNLIQIDVEIPAGFSTSYQSNNNGYFKVELASTGATVYYDDFIVRPVESNFSATVYDGETGRVMSELDEDGLATIYYYDAAGKMSEKWKEIPSKGLKQLKKWTYNFARGAND